MEDPYIIDITVQAMMLVLILSMPAIILATIAGVGISLLQALTQIQEQTLGFAVKLIIVIATLLLTAHFMVSELFNYTINIFKDFPVLGR